MAKKATETPANSPTSPKMAEEKPAEVKPDVPEAIPEEAKQENEQKEEVIVDEVKDVPYGKYIGCCKWFNNKLGYGFITAVSGDKKGTDLFAHHSGIKPLNSNFKTLTKGEYVHFDIVEGPNGLQSHQITGIMGNALMCDQAVPTPGQYQNHHAHPADNEGYQRVSYKKNDRPYKPRYEDRAQRPQARAAASRPKIPTQP